MNRLIVFIGILVLAACKSNSEEHLTAQEIVDNSIEVSGGELYQNSTRSFFFRNINYVSENYKDKKVLKRIRISEVDTILDVYSNKEFKRFVNNNLIEVADTMAVKYANSINSVHYFANLPNGLNDPAVKKELLGVVNLKGKIYHKIKVTFEQENGGDDFDDIYVYWFNVKSKVPDYLAYEFHTDGGGMRFREAFNERYINGIRFVDYKNYKTKDLNNSILKIDSLFAAGSLELLSKIELKNIKVSQGNYN
ncbi:deoxyribose-phosphate aldolase [Kriegella sp. EG-1]|nr:deoxyribose-phosphate aldolase [Flavobacteriaceae bacterium EG-1]